MIKQEEERGEIKAGSHTGSLLRRWKLEIALNKIGTERETGKRYRKKKNLCGVWISAHAARFPMHNVG